MLIWKIKFKTSSISLTKRLYSPIGVLYIARNFEIVNNQQWLFMEDSLPRAKWWGDDYLYQIGGFWYTSVIIEPVNRIVKHFKPLSSDVVLTSFPKTGTTWLKSILYSIINRSCGENLLKSTHPHELVPFLEVHDVPDFRGADCGSGENSRRIFSTHVPYQLLSESLDSAECKVVYVTRNPKDTLISFWKYVNKWHKAKEEPWPLEVAVDMFCRGTVPGGPYYEHVLGYRKLSLERPDNLFFVTYEELKSDPIAQFKKLAEFLGCPFEGDDDGEVREIVKICSFEVLSNFEVNRSEEYLSWFPLPYNSFFRKGEVGDYTNYLDEESIARIDALTREKFHSVGFVYGI